MKSPPALPTDHRRDQLAKAVKDNLALLFGAVAIAWGLELLDTILLGFFDRFGIQPRSLSGLSGVVTSPFLHLGFGHLLSNTLPFLMLGGIVLIGGRKVFMMATLFIVAVGGMALWTLGPSGTNHVGASGLIFGYLGFLLARGIVEKSSFWILVSVVTLILYGGMLGGVFPGQPGISWQGHLFGFVAGLLAARVMFTRQKPVAVGR
ncbi:MAG: rhomboid family intramembrane serine protease [Verrucomicrobiales bacterium]|nr:rhomboid family intramembrane serine protease [Verrucomicrobiales bacterium]